MRPANNLQMQSQTPSSNYPESVRKIIESNFQETRCSGLAVRNKYPFCLNPQAVDQALKTDTVWSLKLKIKITNLATPQTRIKKLDSILKLRYYENNDKST